MGEALAEDLKGVAHHDYAVAQHYQGLVALFADEVVVFLVEVETVIFDEV